MAVAVDQRKLYNTTAPEVWAKEFMKVVESGVKVDEGLMIGWFANAIGTARSMTFDAAYNAGLQDASAALL